MTTTPTFRSRCLVVLGAVPLLVAGLAGCSAGGDGATDATSSEASTEQRADDWDLAFAQCVRDSGFEYDDPTAGSTGVDIQVPDGDAEAYFAALDACMGTVTDDLGERPVTESEKKAGEEAAAEFQRVEECLEEHGVEFPDADGGVVAAPEVPADVAAQCDAEDFFSPVGGDR